MEHLKCPRIESSWRLCDDEASYCIDGVVYCRRHAWFIMENTRQPEWKGKTKGLLEEEWKRKEGELNGNN